MTFDDDAGLLHLAGLAFEPKQTGPVGVAVSGGSDSVAMLHLLVRAGWRLRAVTVDHGLRPEAAAEAQGVARLCAGLGVGHDTLVWQHGAIAGNLPDQARRARYGLIADWAHSQGIAVVAVGHTADDNAETFLMQLGRAAGLDGLCGMRAQWQTAGIAWCRPFLRQSRGTLRAYLRRQGIGWVDDPTNADDHYTRVKARKALATLAPLGITPMVLQQVTGHLLAARQALEAAVAEAATAWVQTEAGAVQIDRQALAALPPEIGRRLLLAALGWVARADYPPRAAALARVQAAIAAGKSSTLAGCCIAVRQGGVRIAREPRYVASQVCPTGQLWDGRWRLTGPHIPGAQVGVLGAEGLRQVKGWKTTGVPRADLLISPAVWRGDTVLAAPLAGLGNGWTAQIVPDFASFIVSH